MARHQRTEKTPAAIEAAARSKIEKLRALRLSDKAARQAAGTWGEMSGGEITHQPTGEIFVHCWKGREAPDLEKLPGKRTAAKRADEHAQLTAWLLKHKMAGFEITLFAWNLSEAEALRAQQARIAQQRALGRAVINEGSASLAN